MTVNGSGKAKAATRSIRAVGPLMSNVIEEVVSNGLECERFNALTALALKRRLTGGAAGGCGLVGPP